MKNEDGKGEFHYVFLDFKKVHLHTTNPQTQSRPMVFLRLTEHRRHRLLDSRQAFQMKITAQTRQPGLTTGLLGVTRWGHAETVWWQYSFECFSNWRWLYLATSALAPEAVCLLTAYPARWELHLQWRTLTGFRTDLILRQCNLPFSRQGFLVKSPILNKVHGLYSKLGFAFLFFLYIKNILFHFDSITKNTLYKYKYI